MNIIITGGAGFIGSNLIRYTINNTEHQVLNIDKLTYAGNLNSLKDIENSSQYQFAQIDICDTEGIQKIFKDFQPDAVMHLAAESHVDRSIDNPGDFIQTNVVGTFNLLHVSRQYFESLESTQKEQFRFLHVSTDEVYGSLDFEEPGFSETTPYDPHSPYSASKAASDHLARAWKTTYKLPVLVTNCSNNYGPYQFPEKLIPVVILKAINNEPIPIYGKGENIRDWLYVEDHAEALFTVLTKGEPGETYNIGGNNEQTNLDLVKLICTILDQEKPNPNGKSYSEQITFVTDRPGHDLRYSINANKIKTQLGWSPKEDFKSGFVKTIRWYLNNQSWWQEILDSKYQLQRLGTQ